MSPTVVTSIGFVVAALILLWACVEIGRRYVRQRKKVDVRTINSWVPLQPTTEDSPEDSLPDTEEEDQEDVSRADIHARAKQNGHYSESQKLL